MTSLKTLLITGATGKQGGALISALLSRKPPSFNILAVTRNPSSPSAKHLASKPNVSLLKGDFDDPAAIFKQAPQKVWGVFAVQLPSAKEETQGKALVDAAVANGVQHFLYSSAERGGPEKSDADPTNVPHFASKYAIEKHLLSQAAASRQKMTWTILRLTAFFDNLTPDFMGKAFAAMWKSMGDTKLMLVSTRDIGRFAAGVFEDADNYRNKAISMAGDELTFDEACEVYEKVIGKSMPVTFVGVGRAIMWAVKDLGLMFKWFVDVGFKVDIRELRRMDPELQDFGTWLKDSSKFVAKR
ncbi:MAG: hypothetical protein M1830_001726 [Pleopsidium flavum]|nr:MAG: hypothetical protein M1830_003811 [Pleopsidium flavum]KAI9872359.1 MAG: hypothetical protein M1830_001726 [Pleopsidium flavum]